MRIIYAASTPGFMYTVYQNKQFQ